MSQKTKSRSKSKVKFSEKSEDSKENQKKLHEATKLFQRPNTAEAQNFKRLIRQSTSLSFTKRQRRKIISDDATEFQTDQNIFDPLEKDRGIVPIKEINVDLQEVGDAFDESDKEMLNAQIFQHFIDLRDKFIDENIDLEFIEKRLFAGADINATDMYGQTILHETVRIWDPEIFDFLVLNGADIFATDDYGVSILHTAAGNDRLDLFLKICEEMSKKSEISYLTAFCAKTKNGQNIVHYAAKYDHPEFVRVILKEAAKIDRNIIDEIDNFGKTPLALAAELDRNEAAKVLLKHNANPGKNDFSGQSCLTQMIKTMPDVAVLALNFFVQVYRTKRKQHFHLYKLGKSVEFVEKLFKKGINSRKSKDKNNQTSPSPGDSESNDTNEIGNVFPLEVAIQNECLEVVTHPVMKKFIDVKWEVYGRKGAIIQLGLGVLLVSLWSITSVLNKTLPYLVCPTAGFLLPLIIWLFAVAFNIYLVTKEIQEFRQTRKRTFQQANFSKTCLEDVIKSEHPRWPDNRIYYEKKLKMLKKDNNPVKVYFQDVWNIIDWIVYLQLIMLTVVRFVDIFLPDDVRESQSSG